MGTGEAGYRRILVQAFNRLADAYSYDGGNIELVDVVEGAAETTMTFELVRPYVYYDQPQPGRPITREIGRVTVSIRTEPPTGKVSP